MKRIIKNKFIVFVLFLTTSCFTSFNVFANEIIWPASPMGTSLLDYKTTTLSDLTQYFYEWGISIGLLFAFVSIVYAGFQYLTSTGDTKKLTEAKGRIWASFWGVALLLGTFLILNTINPALVDLEISAELEPTSLEGQEFISYRLESKCAYAKLYKNSKEMQEDKKEHFESNNGEFIDLGENPIKLQYGSGDDDFYNSVKFFSVPTLYKVTTKYTKKDGKLELEEKEDRITIYSEYPDGYQRLLIKNPKDEQYYVESLGTECKLYLYYEISCISVWGNASNVTYPTNNMADSVEATIPDVRCVRLVQND